MESSSKETQIIINGRSAAREMQIIPSALFWRDRIQRENPDFHISFQITSPFVVEFLNSYIEFPRGTVNPEYSTKPQRLEFPVESQKLPFWKQAEIDFKGFHSSFFVDHGFPSSTCGFYLRNLMLARRNNTQLTAQLFLNIHENHNNQDEINATFWHQLAGYLQKTETPVYIHSSLVPADLLRTFATTGYVDTRLSIYDIWRVAIHLSHSRLYLGCEGFFAQLAYLLHVPCFIIGKENPSLKLESREPNQFVRYFTNPHLEDIQDAQRELERLLLPER